MIQSNDSEEPEDHSYTLYQAKKCCSLQGFLLMYYTCNLNAE